MKKGCKKQKRIRQRGESEENGDRRAREALGRTKGHFKKKEEKMKRDHLIESSTSEIQKPRILLYGEGKDCSEGLGYGSRGRGLLGVGGDRLRDLKNGLT